jgi:hypothetical protein
VNCFASRGMIARILEPILWKAVNQDDARAFAAANVVKCDPIKGRGLGREFFA